MQKPLFVVLAGGSGKRFAPLVTDKILFPFLGQPFIEHVLATIRAAGGKEVLLITNSTIENWLPTYNKDGLQITTVQQPNAHGMGDALLQAKEAIGNRPIVVLNGDDIVEVNLLKDILKAAEKAYALVTGKTTKTYFPGGYLQVSGNRVTSIVEKPGEGNEPSHLINLVVHYFSDPAAFLTILAETKTDTDDHYEQAISKLMEQHDVGFVAYEGNWQALKYSHHVLDMTHLFLSTIKRYTARSAYIAKQATVEGDVYIDEGAKIYENAVIKGPVYIGKNAVIGNHTLVRESIIEAGTVVGFGSEVARSYVGPHCMLHHNYIGDSILEGDINPSYGTCTANWRFDGQPVSVKMPDNLVKTTKDKLGAIIAKGAFLGINCSLMPGITIGANAKVYPNTVVYVPVGANDTLRASQKFIESEK